MLVLGSYIWRGCFGGSEVCVFLNTNQTPWCWWVAELVSILDGGQTWSLDHFQLLRHCLWLVLLIGVQSFLVDENEQRFTPSLHVIMIHVLYILILPHGDLYSTQVLLKRCLAAPWSLHKSLGIGCVPWDLLVNSLNMHFHITRLCLIHCGLSPHCVSFVPFIFHTKSLP